MRGTMITLVLLVICLGIYLRPSVGASALLGVCGSGIAAYVLLLRTPLGDKITVFWPLPAIMLTCILLASGLLWLAWGQVAAVASLVGCVAVYGLLAGRLFYGVWHRRRVVAQIEERLAAGLDPEALLREVITWTTSESYQVLVILRDHGRTASAERIARQLPIGGFWVRADWLVTLRLELGDVRGAREALDELKDIDGRDPNECELAAHARAKLDIAEGRARDVLDHFGPHLLPHANVGFMEGRLLIRANAHAELGNFAESRALLVRVLAEFGDKGLMQLRNSNQQAAKLAAEILSPEDARPYR